MAGLDGMGLPFSAPLPARDAAYRPGSSEDFDRLYRSTYARLIRTLFAVLGSVAAVVRGATRAGGAVPAGRSAEGGFERPANIPAKKPLSHARWAGVKGALAGRTGTTGSVNVLKRRPPRARGIVQRDP